MVAVFIGPIVLAGELGTANMPNDFADKDAYLSVAPVTVPTIANSSARGPACAPLRSGRCESLRRCRGTMAAPGCIVIAP